MPRPIQARINLAAIAHNYRLARQHAGSQAKAWAVVKADAYGHGLLRTATALGELADGFAVLDIEAAASLRDAGFHQPILLLEGFFKVLFLDICEELVFFLLLLDSLISCELLNPGRIHFLRL